MTERGEQLGAAEELQLQPERSLETEALSFVAFIGVVLAITGMVLFGIGVAAGYTVAAWSGHCK